MTGRAIVYFGSNKDRFQLQFPDAVCQRLGTMPKEFLLKAQRKGVKRFWTPFITEKFTKLQQVCVSLSLASSWRKRRRRFSGTRRRVCFIGSTA